MNEQALLIVHLVATAFMTGLIWFVQVVHYPLFASVGREAFVAYERKHTTLTTLVVGPTMLIEAATALWIVTRSTTALSLTGAALLGVVWLSTAFVQASCHRRLERGFDEGVARRLVRTNWIRTVAWSWRTAVAAALLTSA